MDKKQLAIFAWIVGTIAVTLFTVIFHDNIQGNSLAIRENSEAIAENSEAITKLSGQVDSLSTDVGSLSTQVGSLSTEVGSLSTQMGSLSAQVDSLMRLPEELDKLQQVIVKSRVSVAEGKSPLSLNITGRKLADALNVVEFIEDNYDLIVANRPDDSNKLDIQGWSRSRDTSQIIQGILGDAGADKIKNVVFDEGLDLDSDIAVDYIVREVYGIVLRDMIFKKERIK